MQRIANRGLVERGGVSPRRALPVRGFTLIELMVVIAIISVLAALAFRASLAVAETARVRATEATLAKIDTYLKDRKEAFGRYFEGMLNPVTTSDLTYADNNTTLAKIIARKRLFKLAFPQTIAEIHASFDPPAPALPVGFDSSVNETTSSEGLYMMFTRGWTYGNSSMDVDFSASELADTDGDGRMEIVDGWGKPIRFYRWPTRLVRQGGRGGAFTSRNDVQLLIATLPTGPASAPPPYSDLESDPDDQFRLTEITTWTNINNFEVDYHTNCTWSALLAVSAGPDTTLGLFEPGDLMNRGYLAAVSSLVDLADNYSNLKRTK